MYILTRDWVVICTLLYKGSLKKGEFGFDSAIARMKLVTISQPLTLPVNSSEGSLRSKIYMHKYYFYNIFCIIQHRLTTYWLKYTHNDLYLNRISGPAT